MEQVTSIEEYKKVLKEHFPNIEDFDDLYLGKFINDPPWYVIAPMCSDPMGPVEQFSQPLPLNIFPKDLIKGWTNEPIQETSKDIYKEETTQEITPLSTTSTPTIKTRN